MGHLYHGYVSHNQRVSLITEIVSVCRFDLHARCLDPFLCFAFIFDGPMSKWSKPQSPLFCCWSHHFLKSSCLDHVTPPHFWVWSFKNHPFFSAKTANPSPRTWWTMAWLCCPSAPWPSWENCLWLALNMPQLHSMPLGSSWWHGSKLTTKNGAWKTLKDHYSEA